ncbi:MAG: mobile element hypothetical protein [Bacteroidetes bacterium HLUCCA01]|nr:MAG: mobile element hypothetical protein [Bacteroidetes bacterium HLUCCA01]
MKTVIDLSKLMNEHGTFNERDVQAIERATGRKFAEVYAEAEKSAGLATAGFSDEEIKSMSDKEYEANRQAILDSLKRR